MLCCAAGASNWYCGSRLSWRSSSAQQYFQSVARLDVVVTFLAIESLSTITCAAISKTRSGILGVILLEDIQRWVSSYNLLHCYIIRGQRCSLLFDSCGTGKYCSLSSSIYLFGGVVCWLFLLQNLTVSLSGVAWSLAVHVLMSLLDTLWVVIT